MDVIRTYHEDLLATQECFTATVSRDRRLEDPRGFQRQLVATAGANGSMFPQKPGAAFDKQGADIYDRMPPTTARVIWARSLLSRIEQPLLKMNELISPAVQQSEQWKTTAALVAVLQGTINQYIQSQLGTWVGGIDGAQKKLELSLLEKRDDGAVQVNFDKELSKLLREVTYIEGIEECDGKAKDASKVPTSTQSTLADPAGLRSQVYKLEAVCRQYNEMRATVLPMEQAIFAEEFAHCEDLLASGMRNLTWHDASVGRWVASVSATVGDLSAAIGGLRDAVAAVEKALRQFTAEDTFLPLDPKEAKTMPCDEFSRRFAEYNAGRRGKAAAKSTEARRVCAAAFAAVNDFKARRSSPIAPLDENDPPWRAFVSHVNSCCEALVVACVEHALANLRNQLSGEWLSEQSGIPLLDIKLTIDTKANPVRGDFAPPLTQANTRHTGVTLESLVETWIDDCKQYAGVFQTLDDTGRTFSSAVAGHTRCEELAREILLQVGASIDECRAFQRQFDGFAYLWETQLDSVFQKFIDDHTPDLAEASESQLQLQQPPPEDAEITVESFERTFFSGASLDDYSAEISRYNRVQDAIGSLPDGQQCSWLRIDAKPMKIALRDCCAKWRSVFVNHLVDKTRSELDSLYSFVKTAESELEIQVTSLDDLKSVMKWVRECKQLNPKVEIMFEPMGQVIAMLKRQACISDDLVAELENLRRDGPETWLALHKKSLNIREEYSKMQDQEADRVEEEAQEFLEVLSSFAAMFDNTGAFSYLDDTDAAYTEMDHIHLELLGRETESSRFNSEQALFDLEKTDFRLLKECRQKLRLLKGIWDLIAHVRATFAFWYETPFMAVDVEELSDEVTKLLKQLKSQPTKTKSWPCFEGLQADVKRMSMSLPLIQDLREEAVRDRHWVQLLRETDHANLSIDPRSTSCTLLDLLSLSLHEHQDIVQNTVEKATKELQLETNLNRVATTWNAQKFTYEYDDNLAAWTLGKVDDISDELDSDTNLLQQMQSNRFVAYFQEPVAKWMDNLGKIESTLLIWLDAQKRWTNLYPIFVKSQDIRVSLPDDAKVFESADELYREMMDKIRHHENVVSVCCSDLLKKVLERDDDIEEVLGIVLDVLRQCEKALADYLESKKRLFPRFFFLADADLVDILSKGSQPKEIMTHMSKIVDAVDTFNFLPDRPSTVHGIVSIQGEKVPLAYEYTCQGAVEDWLSGCIDVVRASIKAKIDEANSSYMEQPRISWIFNCCCQAVIVASRLQFTWETNSAFAQLEDGNELAMKDHMQLQQKQLSEEIRLVLGELSTNDRSMLVHLITIDVHNRDIIQWLIDEKAENDTHFTWQSQLRYLWHEAKGVVIKICDSEFAHGYEYVGLCGCLVVTKLTDRCYITLTQALKLMQGGAPAGPAGTGKTETTKDLARNLGIACYVFNCSDQMNYQGLGRIFKGLAMSGCWGCFDEFNRISIEVLSVVATQISSILYGLRMRKQIFKFANEEDISLVPTCGAFVTMNPGYAGRTELPENIKSLFRPCAMVVPDIQNICEILLAAEGFVEAKSLALKFVQLYKLNKELLSQQLHYDWGLRAVKSVLVIAGTLRRDEQTLDEKLILLRALRDTNLAKLSKDDVYVFRGLIKALFPSMAVARKVDEELKGRLRVACAKLQLFAGENDTFVEKCLQFDELLRVRHSVFVLGPAGCGKTECRNALRAAFLQEAGGCKVRAMNPKAITANEMYGTTHEQTKEWREGHLAHIFKEFSVLSKTNTCRKWIVLDGIIDAEWIESMNTVMDDNKMLTLANNDRIPLTPSMRMVFEISQLQNASPATVSRAGILYINDVDVGWNPFVDRWLLSREDEREHNYLDSFFDSYLPSVFEQLKKGIATVVQIADISLVQTLCALLDALLHNVPHGSPQEVYEKYFCFALVWAFGGALASDGRVDYRAAFSKWWVREMQSRVRICDEKYQVFDFYISKETHHEFCSWNELVAKYKTDPDLPMSEQLVETAETVRMQQMLQLLMTQQHPVLLVGMAGTGKSKIVLSKLAGLDSTNWMTRHTSFNAKTTARTFQLVLEANLERSGRKWHPPGRKKLVFFMDDLNMPLPDKYGTQEPIALLRQYLDYGFWFDRGSPGVEKHVAGIQLVASMNHKAGSFTILDRALRWFSVFALSMPGGEDLTTIYQSLLAAHVRSWSSHVRNLVPILVNATVELLQAMREQFLPTAAKFHYHWNLREVSNVFQGLTSTMRALHDGDAILFIRLWKHECERVFRDRMVDEHETAEYDSLCAQVVTKYFSDVVVVDDVLREPNLWAPFGQHGDEIDIYDQIDSFEQLSVFLEGKLDEYNEDTTRARMDLVLFNQAMEHVTRICRILSRPNGNALLIGVGGSGKQSLSRLSAFINEMDAYQIMVTQTYNGSDFRRNVSELYIKCGRKNQRFAFVITDAQIVCSQQLVVLNDMLNSGNVPNLFEPEVADEITHAMLPELRQRQHPDYHNKEVCWKYFISKVQANLHTVLCFSPVGQQLATWCRHFPALATTTVIDWFHSWAPEALFSVSRRFLSAPDFALSGESSLVDACASSISETHLFVTSLADEYKAKNRRYCYTTPKSFMELISTYKNMLRDKRLQQAEKTRRLVDGIHKIKLAKDSVHELQVKLKDEDTEVRMASQEVATLMEQVSTDKAAIQEEAERAEVEKKKTEKLVTETDALKAEAERDLAAAQPLVERAKAALKSLNKASLTELKSFTKPPQEVLMVTAAVMCLTAHPNRIPRPEIAKDWSNAKKMMSNISQWLKELEDFGANMSNDIPQPCIDAIQVWVRDPNFDAECMKSKSEAASCLSAWVSNMDAYHTLRCQVRPKEEKLQEARERLEVSKSQFQAVQDHVTNLNNKLNALVEAHNTASEKSRILKEKVESTRLKMNIAERLVSGLADENIRWSRTVEELREGMHQLVGDVLVAAAFISYAGPFSSEYRERLIDHLNKDVQMRRIPHMEGQDVVTGILTSEAEVAAWNNEGLPTDRISTENGAIVKTAKRWPLLIDPQLQGITWIKAKEASHGLVVTQQGNTRYLDDVIHCLQMGLPCLIQNLPETIDPILDPILSKEFARKGTSYTCKVGDKDVDVNISTFRLYLQTKHPNPHYKPELNAQTTLVNFMVTESGLEDQLLAVVVNMERPELEERRAALIRQMNQYKIDLSSCEDKLLIELSNAEGDLLENVVLITNLEDTKKQAGMIAKALIDDRVTQEELMEQRLVYKPAATRGSLIFFEIDRLAKINSIYQYSLEAFMSVYSKALQKADSPEPDSDEEDEEKRRHTTGRQRLQSLMRSITETVCFCST
ncbi:Dynein beta chain [Diplonema papillatum]|nr:Dynein beta chain [Diplonema papillatum]